MGAPDGPRFETFGGVSWWLADPTGFLRRAGHVVDLGTGRYAIDPVDCDGLDGVIDAGGGLDGVAVLMDRHARDARRLATRHGVDVHVPEGADRIAAAVGGPVSPLEGALEAVEVRWVYDRRVWEEVALWWPADGTLLVPESLGTSAYFTAGGERVGVHPLARLFPPRRALGDLEPARLFVGHGEPITDVRPDEVATSLAAARRRLPRAVAGALAAWRA